MSNCLIQLSRLTPRARLHVAARDKTTETTARQAQTVTGAAAGEGKVIATAYWSEPTTTLHVGDARDVLATMPDASADCIVTSPPYWAKRDYGVTGQYGHEPDPAAYAETLRAVFREARRVLADDGTCWLNLGDSYSVGGAAATGLHAYLGRGLAGRRAPGTAAKNAWDSVTGRLRAPRRRLDPAQRDRLAQTQRHAGIRARPAQLPPRADLPARQAARLLVRPRPDPRAARHRSSGVREPGGTTRHQQADQHRHAAATARPGRRHAPRRHPAAEVRPAQPRGHCRPAVRHRPPPSRPPARPQPRRRVAPPAPTAARTSRRSLDIPLRCIAAGCKPGGTVLDMFCGAGTTGIAARQLGRRFTGIELNPAFAALAAERLRHADPAQPDGAGPEPRATDGGSR